MYELTEAGEAALQHWLAADAEPSYELRDEGMLKLFFSDSSAGAADRQHSRDARAIGAQARSSALDRAPRQSGTKGSYLTLQMGIGMTECMVEWCEATERQLGGDENE